MSVADEWPENFESPLLEAAATALRDRPNDRWVEISTRILSHALTAVRRSKPVRAQASGGVVHISEQVLTAHLQAALDGISGIELDRVSFDLDGDVYRGLELIVTVQYNEPIIPLADAIRNAAAAELTNLLGPVTPAVTVTTMRVHVDDVSQSE